MSGCYIAYELYELLSGETYQPRKGYIYRDSGKSGWSFMLTMYKKRNLPKTDFVFLYIAFGEPLARDTK